MNFDANLHHDNGYTPLAYAAMRGSVPMIELLLRSGVDPADHHGQRQPGGDRAALRPCRGGRSPQGRAPPRRPAVRRGGRGRGRGGRSTTVSFPVMEIQLPSRLRAGNQPRHPAREVRQGRRAVGHRGAAPRGARLAQVEREAIARNGSGASSRRRRKASSRRPHQPAAGGRCRPRSSTASCSRWATRSRKWSTAGRASTPRCRKPPRPCAAAAASATTSPPSAPRARR